MKNKNFSNANLTQYEVSGLKSAITFADGHAYHGMPDLLKPITQNIQTVWAEASGSSIPEMEEKFKQSVAKLINSETLRNHTHFSLCPTASNSIDIAGAWLKTNNINIGLIEPAFDNLYLLLKRREVKVTRISELDMKDLEILEQKVDDNNLKSLFLVSPNNPTGFQLDVSEFRKLCDFCKKKDITLILDTTFRFYSRKSYDEYQILETSGSKYLVIEDTGKTWPTEDLKISMMAYSESIAAEMRELYEEVYLCSSNFSMALLSNLIEVTSHYGIENILWPEVDRRKIEFRSAIANTPLTLMTGLNTCPMPLEWLDCSQTGLTDLEFVDIIRKHNIALLPGRFFYWGSQDSHTSNIRASLMCADEMFTNGLNALKNALHHEFGTQKERAG